MPKYKLCPACGEKNPPALLECRRCEADLTAVRLFDSEKNQSEKIGEDSGEEAVRICECGYENPVSSRKCQRCGEDISDIAPSVRSGGFSDIVILEAADESFCYELKSGETLLGRENEMAGYLSSRSFVSRLHAKIRLSSDGVFIQNLSRTNFTYINNNKLTDASEIKLSDGDEIGLGGNSQGERQSEAAYFTMRIKKCI